MKFLCKKDLSYFNSNTSNERLRTFAGKLYECKEIVDESIQFDMDKNGNFKPEKILVKYMRVTGENNIEQLLKMNDFIEFFYTNTEMIKMKLDKLKNE